MTVCSDSTSATPAHDPVSILDHFADLPDPRREPGRIHQLDEIVFIATCAVFCGADNWVQIADYFKGPWPMKVARNRPVSSGDG
jgi:DDE_Tnp_1-associated